MTDDSASVADEVESNPNSHTYITIFIVLTIKKKKKKLKICRAQTRSCARKEKEGGWESGGVMQISNIFLSGFFPRKDKMLVELV